MVRKSRYPNALDVRQVVTAERVAKIAGADTDAARVVINAHLFGLVAMAASGATVVSRERGVDGPPDSAVQKFVKKNVMTLLTDTAEGVRLADVVAASMPSNSPTPRYDPVFGADLLLLTESLARGYVPDISTADVDAIMETWWNLCDEAPPGLVFRRTWEVSEKDFENWFELHLHDLFDIELAVAHRQWRSPSGGIADLIARVVQPAADPTFADVDFIVIENKCTQATPGAVQQVERYAQDARECFGARVIAILAAEGIGDATEAAADDCGVITLTWGELGYLDHLWCPKSVDTPIATFLDAINEGSPWDRNLGR